MILGAVGVSVLGPLTPFLIGALILEVTNALRLTEAEVGLGLGAFFLASALGSAPLGRMIDRLGPEVSAVWASLVIGVALVGIAAGATSIWTLLPWLVLAGLANAGAHPAANALLARYVDPRRQGMALGVKQAAIPGAVLLAGLAVPVAVHLVEWRWVFGGAGLLAVLVALLTRGGSSVAFGGDHPRVRPVPSRSLVVLGVASALGIAAMNGTASFLVSFLVSRGVEVASAGWLLVLASVLAVAVRLGVGVLADRWGFNPLALAATLLLLGAGGLLALSSPRLPLLPALMVTGAAGWGWPGLMNLAVIQGRREAAGAATGITETGTYAGGGAGPVLVGLTATGLGFEAAWVVLAAMGGLAGLLVWYTQRPLVAAGGSA